ncbi:MAG TPA: hypothetical protein VG736_10935 [Vicinamibacterales bacterium]|jgi:hypothetical protein|nr:hypothetical protein [Vicinamibacterales bacterium]
MASTHRNPLARDPDSATPAPLRAPLAAQSQPEPPRKPDDDLPRREPPRKHPNVGEPPPTREPGEPASDWPRDPETEPPDPDDPMRSGT